MWTLIAAYTCRQARRRSLPAVIFLLAGLAVFGSTGQGSAQVIGPGGAPPSFCPTYDEFGAMYFAPCPQNPEISIDKIADERIGQMVKHAQLTRILLGSYEQINCTNTCVSAFGAVGSFSAGFHGRKYVTDRISLIGGLSINNYKTGSVETRQALIGALGMRYDFVDWGSSRPFFEVGGSVSPNERSRTLRTYLSGGSLFRAVTTAQAESYMAYVRAGWVKRVTPRDEFSLFADLVRQWHVTRRVSELPSAANPFPAVYQSGTDMMNVARITAQHVHLFGTKIEFHVNAGLAHSFDVTSGVKVNIFPLGQFQAKPASKTWFEYGARIGFRVNKTVTIDTFLVGASGPKPVGNSIHGGIGVRSVF